MTAGDRHSELLAEGLALLALDPRNAPAALARFEQAQAIAPAGDATAWLNAGVVLDRMGRAAEAVAALSAGLARQPDHHGVWTNLAFIAGRGDPAGGVSRYRALLARWPEDAVAWANLGTLLERSGQSDEARAAYERALELDETLTAVRTRLQTMRTVR